MKRLVALLIFASALSAAPLPKDFFITAVREHYTHWAKTWLGELFFQNVAAPRQPYDITWGATTDLKAVGNCNMSSNYNGSGCANDTFVLQQALNAAACAPWGHVTLQLTSGYAVNSIQLKSCTSIVGAGWDTGFVEISGSNSHVIRTNPNPAGYIRSITGVTQVTNLVLQNFRINGNRPANSTYTANLALAPNGAIICGISLEYVSGALLDHLYLWDTSGFGFYATASDHVVFRDSTIYQNSKQLNQDGAHLAGSTSYIYFTNLELLTGDDGEVLAAPEGVPGAIHDVTINGEHCISCYTAVRTLSNEYPICPGQPIQNLSVSNVTGTAVYAAVALGFGSGCTLINDEMGSMTFDNLHLNIGPYSYVSSLGCFLAIADAAAKVTFTNAIWDSPLYANGYICPGANYGPAYASDITIGSGSGIYMTAAGQAAAYAAQLISGQTFTTLDLKDFTIRCEKGQSCTGPTYLTTVPSGAAIGRLILPSDPTFFASVSSSGDAGRITTVQGDSLAIYTANAPGCTSTSPAWRITVLDATAPLVGSALTGGGAVWAHAHCSQTSAGYIVDGI